MAVANRKRRVGEGQTARWEYHQIYAFTTTGTTKTCTVPMGRVESVQLTAIGTPASTDGPLSVNNTVSGTVGQDDAAIVGSNGATDLVVTRPAGTTSGLKFSLRATGR